MILLSKSLILIPLAIILIILSGIGGFLIGKSKVTLPEQLQNRSSLPKTDPRIFYKQYGEIKGELVGVKGEIATVRSGQNITSDFKITNQVYVTKYDKTKSTLLIAAKDLEVNKQALIALEIDPLAQTQPTYQITSITYYPSLPLKNSLKEQASQTAQPAKP